MALRISLLLSILVPILAFVNKYNNPHGKITKQTGFSLIRHVDAEKKATSEVFPDENPVTPHPDATQEDVDKAAPEQPTNPSYYNSIHGKDLTNNDRPSTKHQGTTGLENFDPPEESIVDSINVINIRRARATSALDLDKFKTVDLQQQGVYNVSHLASMCPYTDICDIQGREVQEKNMDSCCLPCSCSSTCGDIGNCCDKRENIGNMCHYPLVNVGNTEDIELEFQYFLVDKCLNESHNDCKEMGAESWGSLYPVYDPLSQVNFYNPQCAKCNGVEEYTKWELTLVCGGNGDGIENELIGRVLRGEEVERCSIKFRPPKTMDILKSVCSNEIPFDRCNITGTWKNYDANLEEACLRWHAPVLRRSGQILYANKYCQLCNGGVDHDLCITMDPDRFAARFTLTYTIDYRQVPALVETYGGVQTKPTETGVCSKGMVKHVIQPDCRKVLCPNGFVGSEGSCRPLLAKLLNDLYYIKLQLTPSTDTLLPYSYLRDLTEDQRENPQNWFDAQGAPLDYFELHSKGVTVNKTEYVESLVVGVGRKKYPLNLDREIKSIKASINKPWAIMLKGEVFQFSVRFYRYRWYIPTQYATNKRHVLNYLTLSGDTLASEPSSPDEHYESDIIYIGSGNPFALKKTNFCNRVRLTRSEWIAGFEEIRLNTSKEIFGSNKRLGNSEFDIFLDETGEPTVEICVEDFNPNHQEQQASGTNTASMLSRCGILLTTAIWVGYSRHVG